jgi:hypothetical protein
MFLIFVSFKMIFFITLLSFLKIIEKVRLVVSHHGLATIFGWGRADSDQAHALG